MRQLEDDPVQMCLETWTAWMNRQDRDLGMKGMRLENNGGSSKRKTSDTDEDGQEMEDAGYEDDGDSVYFKRDNEIAAAVDASISGLEISHQWALKIKCGLMLLRCWRFPQLDFMAETEDAVKKLETKLRSNLATRSLF